MNMNKQVEAFSPILGFDSQNIKNTFKFGIYGGILIGLLQFPYSLFFSSDVPEYFLDYYLKIKSNLFLSLFIGIVVAPFFEELIFRGWIFSYLFRKFNRIIGYIGSTCLFLLAHWSISGLLFIVISSLLLTYIFEKTRLLGASIIAHMVWNVIWYAATIYSFNSRGLM